MEFKEFSKKQIIVLTWWLKNSKYNNYDSIICDGSIRSGKTLCMSISFVLWAFYKFNNSAFGLCGKTIRSLRRNLVTPILPVLKNLGFECRQKISENILEIIYEDRTNIFYLFGGKDESSASLIQGMALSGVLFDEVALMPRSFVEQALARCSVSESKFWFNCNPEYPGHWFYTEWILKKESRNSLYLKFNMNDNPSLSENLKQRYEKLYTGVFYQRFIKGEWVALEGLVYPFMSQDISQNLYYSDVPINNINNINNNFEKYILSCDYGIVNPTSCGLWGLLNNIWYRIDEYYYDSRKHGETRTDEEHYKYICNMLKDNYVLDQEVSYIIVDPSAASFITLIKKNNTYRVIPAKNNVIEGIKEVSRLLKRGDIKICKNCTNSIREFSLYRWQSGVNKDNPVKENDHAMDDIRYFVSTALSTEYEDEFCAFAYSRN